MNQGDYRILAQGIGLGVGLLVGDHYGLGMAVTVGVALGMMVTGDTIALTLLTRQ
jgi:hypothetical protein